MPASLKKVTIYPSNYNNNLNNDGGGDGSSPSSGANTTSKAASDALLKKVMKSLWQCILGYSGEINLSYPAMLAQEILRIALE